MEMTERGIGVVGGGPAGLAAAWRLRRSGWPVRVYEASAEVGGRLRTEAVAGRGADVAVQLLSDGYDRTLSVLEAMGLRDRIVPVPGRDALWRRGRLHELSYGSVTRMVASGALPTGLKLRLGLRYLPFLERHAGVLDLNEPARAVASGLDDVSIAEWGREELGEDFVEWLVYPLLAAYYGVTPEETSAAFFHSLARSGMGVEVVGVRGGMGSLAAGMAESLRGAGVEIRTGAAVASIESTAAGVRLGLADGGVEHDAVVVAVPPSAAASLVPSTTFPGEVRTRSLATLVLSTRTRLETGWFGLSIPRTETGGETLAAVCVQAEKGTGVEGDGFGGTLVLVPAPETGARWAEAEPGAALDEAIPVLDRILPSVVQSVEEARLIRLRDGAWLPEPGHFRRAGAFDPSSLPDRVALAGDYLVAPTVEGAVRSGLAAADRLLVTAGVS